MGRTTQGIALVGAVAALALVCALGGFCCVETAESCHTQGTHAVRATTAGTVQVRSCRVTMVDSVQHLSVASTHELKPLAPACPSYAHALAGSPGPLRI